MAKTIIQNTLETAYPRYQHPDGVPRSYPPGRVVEVGRLDALESAIANAQPNDTIKIVWPGTYNITSTLVPAAPNVHVMADTLDPTEVVIAGRGMDNASFGSVWHGFYSQHPGLKLSNLTLRDFYFHGVTFGAGATSPEFTNLRVLDCGQQFIKASAFPQAINNGRVIGCYFGYTNGRPTTDHDGAGYFYGGYVDVHDGLGWIVRGCVAEDITPTAEEVAAVPVGATQHLWSPAFYFWNGSADTLFENNIGINCARFVAFGLDQKTGFNDHSGGIIRNNMCVMNTGYMNESQIVGSDGMIMAWDSPNTRILHNTILTNNQVNNSIQGRWSQGLEISGNLSDRAIFMRDSATYSGVGNQLNAVPAWFVDPAAGNLRLNATGNANVGTTPQHPLCLTDIDGIFRNNPAKIGAHRYG